MVLFTFIVLLVLAPTIIFVGVLISLKVDKGDRKGGCKF